MLNYVVEGNGSHLLLIHGWGVTFNIWQNLTPILKEYFTLVMIELPGMGASALPETYESYHQACAEAIVELRQALGIEKWAVLSYSAGARAGEVYMQHDIDHVRHAVFLCPAHLSLSRTLGLRFLLGLDKRWPGLGNWVLSDWRLHSLVVLLGFNGRRNPYATSWTTEISTQPVFSLKETLCDLARVSRAPISAFGLPALFVWGRDDLVVARPRRLRPNDRIIAASHGAPLLAASAIAEAVVPFLCQV